MEKQTFILTALPNGFADGRARLSVFIAHRLWSDNASAAGLTLASYPDLVAWPARLSALSWSASIDGGAAIPLALDANAPDGLLPNLWPALFTAATRVEPYLFDDYRGLPVESDSLSTLHGLLADLYGRASADPAYGAGRLRPGLDVLGKDPDLLAVARPSAPPPEPEASPPDTAPIPYPDAPRPVEEPDPLPEQPEADDDSRPGCAMGCLALPLELLRRLLGLIGLKIEPWAKGGLPPTGPTPPSSQPMATPSFDTTVVAPPPPPPPAAAKSFEPPPDTALDDLQKVRREASYKLTNMFQEVDGAKDLPSAAELSKSWDFHRAVSALGDYPRALRWLGLVVDLILPDEFALPASGTIAVTATDPGWSPGTTVVSPRTRFTSSATLFTAAPRPADAEILDGFLRLDDESRFLIVQNEVAGDAIKVSNTATHALRFADAADRPFGMAERGGLPALRSTGLSVARRQAATELKAQFVRSCAFNRFVVAKDGSAETQPAGTEPAPTPTPADELFAEDLVRGYRIDVHDSKAGRWFSLCERDGSFDFLDAQPPVTGMDEGFVQLAATEPQAPAGAKLRITESLFTWSGWSLAAPRPGLAIMPDDSHADPANEAATGFRLETSFRARKGSLPRLRFGRSYKLRARVADLAGNSVVDPSADDFQNDGPAVTPEIVAQRFEPVSPPILMMRSAPVEGESLERLVVRTPAPAGLGTITERHVAPPKVSQLTAELHGGLDDVLDGSAAGYDRASRESKSVSDDAVQVRPALDGLPGAPGSAESDHWIQPADFVTVGYLPDPQARGVVLTEESSASTLAQVAAIDFAGAWPDLRPFRIEVKAIAQGAPAAAPAFTPSAGGEGTGVLTVELAPAQTIKLRINCRIDATDLDSRGVWEWTKQQAPANLNAVAADIAAGRHWAHLPWRELTLVHAVQKPLAPPAIISLTPSKGKIGDTFATIKGTASADNASSARLQLRARWTDWVDDPDLGAVSRHANAEVGEVTVAESGTVALDEDAATKKDLIQEFGDTRYHRVDYVPVAVTRFREYFPATTNTPNSTTLEGLAFAVDVLNSGVPAPLEFLHAVPLFEWDSAPDAPGVTQRIRRGGGLRVYLDHPWNDSGNGELLGILFLDGTPFPAADDVRTRALTLWGADPIGRGALTSPAATKASFAAAVDHSTAPLPVPGEDTKVMVAGHEVRFDKDRKLWYADLRIDCGDSYWPFVRLALARYQPKSIKGAHLSPVHRTSFIPLPPTRQAKIQVTEPIVKVRVTGPVHELSEAITSFPTGAPSNGLNEIELLIEEHVAGADPADPLGWTAIETTRTLVVQDKTAPGIWKGAVTLPGPLAGNMYRLALREYEWHRSDDSASDDRYVFARRLVYADTFAL